ncbi:MAG: T9SS type A sorting domain-containing protein, partial [Bacteroidales bacterium]
TYDKEGKYVAKLTVKNAYGSDVKTVLVNVQNATSVNTIKQTDIVVSPTDVDQYLKVQLAQKGNYLIQVYNSTGILQKNVNRSCCENEIVTIDMNVPSGIYFVKVISNDITVNLTKVIKK